MQNLTFEFTGAAGSRFGAQQLTADISGAFSAWIQSAPSRDFGGQFTIAVTFLVNGNISDIESVAVTANNASGASSPVRVSLR
jgi:hypothetical protein